MGRLPLVLVYLVQTIFFHTRNVDAGHFCVLIRSSPRTHLHLLHFPLRHYLTNQPYQLFESGALPNYDLCGSEDADECKSITGRSHQLPLTLCRTHRPDPSNPAPRITARCRWGWFSASSFVSFSTVCRPRLPLPTLMKTDPPAGHAKS